MEKIAELSERLNEAIRGKTTATRLAERIGMSKQAISSYITGARAPKKPVINALAEALGVNPLWLMGYDVDKKGDISETIYERIKKRRIELGMTVEDLANKMGYKDRSSISKIENGKTDIPQAKVLAFARALNTTTAYLIGAEGDIQTYNNRKTRCVPIYGCIRAGTPTQEYENIEDWEDISLPYNDNTNYAFLSVKGDSMLPRIAEGDLALVNTDATVKSGDVAVVLVNGDEATIKKVYIDDGGVTLHAFNPYYPDIHYTPEKVETLPVRFFGRVVETRSKY